MSQAVHTSTKSYTAGGAIGAYLRVVLSAGVLAVASALQRALGTNEYAVFASGDGASVRLPNATGTRKMVANGAIDAGAYVYAGASGKVGPTGFYCVGQAQEAATANNDVIEVLPMDGPPCVAAIAAAGTTAADATAVTASINTVSAADGSAGVILQAIEVGDAIEVYNEHATNGLKIYPQTGGTLNGGSANAALTIEGKTRSLCRRMTSTNWAVTFTANT